MFESIRKNKIKTSFIVFLTFVFLAVVVYFIAYFTGYAYYAVPIAIAFAVPTSFFSYYFSDKIILSISRARPADQATDKKLRNILEGVCVASGMPMPKLYIMDDASPNAFATGRNPKKAVVCVTTGLMERLDYYELEGVLAHEMAHVKNYDILVSTIVTVMVGIVVMLANIWSRSFLWGGSRKRSSKGGGGGAQLILLVIGLVFIILAPIAGQIMKMALSRNREYLADATGVEFTRNPDSFISALEKISDSPQSVKHVNDATATMYIVNPLKSKSKSKGSLFSTHPPIEARIEAIRNLR